VDDVKLQFPEPEIELFRKREMRVFERGITARITLVQKPKESRLDRLLVRIVAAENLDLIHRQPFPRGFDRLGSRYCG
jgi:hypothetical protein